MIRGALSVWDSCIPQRWRSDISKVFMKLYFTPAKQCVRVDHWLALDNQRECNFLKNISHRSSLIMSREERLALPAEFRDTLSHYSVAVPRSSLEKNIKGRDKRGWYLCTRKWPFKPNLSLVVAHGYVRCNFWQKWCMHAKE